MTTEVQSVGAVSGRSTRFGWRSAALAFLITLAALFLFAVAFAAGYAAFHQGDVLPGVQVGSVPVAGLDRAQAEAAIRSELPDLGAGKLTLRVGDRTEVISYAEIGRDYDMAAMLDSALGVGRAGNPIDQASAQLRTMVNGVSVPLAVSWDADRLAELIGKLSAAAYAAPVDATIVRPDGRYVVSPAVAGQSVDAEAILAQAMAALDNLSAADTTLTITPTEIAPAVSTEQAQAAADQANGVAESGLNVSVAGQQRMIAAETINGWLHLDEVAPGDWQLAIEQAPIAQWASLLKSDVDIAAKDAGYTFKGNHPVVTEAASGRSLDADAAAAAVYDALMARAAGTATGSVSMAMTTVEPKFSTAEAQTLVTRVKRLSSWTTFYESSAHNGFGQNIRRPTRLINGTVVEPGETFDYLAVAGPITVKNGYTDGAAIIHGNSVLDGVLGGGLCSSSTTLFNAALRAGFDMGARRNHAYYIDRYPVGLDATIWVNGSYAQSMSFTNDSAYPILIRGINRKKSVTFSIYGVPDGRHVHLSKARVWDEKPAWTQYKYVNDGQLQPGGRKRIEYAFDGFQSSVERVVTDTNGAVLHDDTFRSSYRRVVGLVLIGWQPGDPPPGTVKEPGKPAGS
jgi:vancomycin resistance protein YoaR